MKPDAYIALDVHIPGLAKINSRLLLAVVCVFLNRNVPPPHFAPCGFVVLNSDMTSRSMFIQVLNCAPEDLRLGVVWGHMGVAMLR